MPNSGELALNGKSMMSFYRGMLKEKKNQDELCAKLRAVIGDPVGHYEIKQAGPEWGDLDSTTFLSIPSYVEDLCLKGPSGTDKVSVGLDNSLSPRHTLLQISCNDRKGLLYDCMPILKDFQMQVFQTEPFLFSKIEKNYSNFFVKKHYFFMVFKMSEPVFFFFFYLRKYLHHFRSHMDVLQLVMKVLQKLSFSSHRGVARRFLIFRSRRLFVHG